MGRMAPVIALLLLAVPAEAQSTRELVRRLSEYVAAYEAQLPAIVADERYEQRAERQNASPAPDEGVRRLESEFAWVRLPRVGETIGVREVRRLDGSDAKAGDRLRTLLEHPPTDPDAEIRAILAESSRHNLGPDQRNFNFPTFPLVYARPAQVRELSWKRRHGSGGRVWLRFTEPSRRTVVRTPEGRPVRATGEFLVEPATGRIERALLELSAQEPISGVRDEELRFSYRLDVVFAEDARLNLWLPQRMDDAYVRDLPENRLAITGRAEYSDYRRYETQVRVRGAGL